MAELRHLLGNRREKTKCQTPSSSFFNPALHLLFYFTLSARILSSVGGNSTDGSLDHFFKFLNTEQTQSTVRSNAAHQRSVLGLGRCKIEVDISLSTEVPNWGGGGGGD